MSRIFRILICDRGAAAIEFALIAPMFLMMLLGLMAYGGYFWRAHALQEIANDAARAALSGLTASERRDLALAAVTAELPSLAGADVALTSTDVSEASGAITVAVVYDASRDAFLNLGLVPMPAKLIRRRAAVRLGGL